MPWHWGNIDGASVEVLYRYTSEILNTYTKHKWSFSFRMELFLNFSEHLMAGPYSYDTYLIKSVFKQLQLTSAQPDGPTDYLSVGYWGR